VGRVKSEEVFFLCAPTNLWFDAPLWFFIFSVVSVGERREERRLVRRVKGGVGRVKS
jgi:hypothetical protein